MIRNFQVIFGGIIAYILLVLYTGTVIYMTKNVVQYASIHKEDINNKSNLITFSDGLTYVVTTIGGLISALVVAKLAITKPGENPATMALSEDAGDFEKKLANWLTMAYLGVWLATGFAALLVGVMIYPNVNSTLGEIGTTWLGLAVASGYAYFGIKPQ